MYQKYFKRVLDFCMALAGTVVLSPVLLALAVWVRLDSKGPVFFRQKRVGKGKRLFDILKFRTMYADTPHDVPTHLLQNPDAERDKYGVNALVPGLTGYAQVHGRDELPIPVKAERDGYYAAHLSFALDVQIFFQTIWNVLAGSGVVEGGTHGK